VVGAALAGFVVLAYLGLVTALGALFGRGTLTAIAATAVIAFVFHPVQRAVQAAVHRLVHGNRPAPQQVLSAFAQRAAAVAEHEAVLTDLAALVAAGVGATRAVVSLRLGDRLRPPPLDGPLVAVCDGGEQVGAVSVALRAGAEPTPADEALLADVAALAAPVLRALRLRAELRERNAELAASRARLATAATQERRRLERDLHDGAQQRLVGILLALRLLRTAPGTDAAALLAAEQELERAIDDLRDLSRGLFPAVLRDEGLSAAVHALAETHPVSVREMPAERLAASVETTAYLVVARAVAAGPVVVAGALDGDGLVLTVVVRGASPDLAELHDRAEALGGSLTVSDDPQGTRLRLALPAADEP
jgi:signal transduction histidine kinase